VSRIVCHFSCGAASAVATKLILATYPLRRIVIYNAFIKEEHEDNRRFLRDCEQWFGFPITVLRDKKYGASTHEVWRKERFMTNGIWGAPCSMRLKREVIDADCFPDDVHVLGYTVEEQDRVVRFTGPKGERRVLTPLIDRNLSHNDCLEMVTRAGIELPLMYRLGFNNANCIGCPKGGEGYWNKTRQVFPGQFVQIQDIQEDIGPGAYFFRDRKTEVRYGLKDLPPNKGRHDEPLPSCSFFCDMAEQEIDAHGQ
jgi:hypothetical protein